MKCDDCGGLMTTDKHAVRRYDIGGLPHVELRGIEVTRCTVCGKEEMTIPRIGQLHAVLADAFVKQRRMLAGVEVRFLRKHVGLSTDDFAQRIGVVRETVCRWETGSTAIGPQADRLLRLMVLTHTPPESYAVDDLLRDLTNARAPRRLSAVAMRNSKVEGWRPESGKLVAV